MLQHTPHQIVLASSSSYRAALLQRLGMAFSQAAPSVDEQPHAGEAPAVLAGRLARDKARAVRPDSPALIIGSDQVAVLEPPDDLARHALSSTPVLGKPGSADNACRQLQRMSGRVVVFYTSVCVLDSASGGILEALDTTRATLRTLDASTIERYVRREQPLDCAGSFKVEGLGISLFERIDSQDPTALVGLPLIATARLLRDMGCAIP